MLVWVILEPCFSDISGGTVDLDKIRTYSISERLSKVHLDAFASPHEAGGSFSAFLGRLPRFLAARDLLEVAERVVQARKQGRPVILGMGAHAIKVGLSPVIIDLLHRGIITSVAMNGACIVHDFELAFAGATSEDVDAAILDGSFGMARETGALLNQAINQGVARGLGLGPSVGRFIEEGTFGNKKISLLATCFRLGIPATVHVALGTDIIHMHPSADGASIGEGSLRDFRTFVDIAGTLEGGVYINLGSAVVLPEVFLKVVTLARNLGNTVGNLTTVNMDFVQHYRPGVNVLKRPTLGGGKAFALTGHHEIMLPLLAAAVVEATN